MRPVLLAVVALLLLPTASHAADVVAPGGGEDTNLIGGCGDPAPAAWCGYVQFDWYPTDDRTDGRPGQIPWLYDGVITRVRVPFYKPGGQFSVSVVRGVDRVSGGYMEKAVSTPALPVPDSLRADVPVRLPIARNQLLMLSITADAEPFVVYTGGGNGPGSGRMYFVPDANAPELQFEPSGSTTTELNGWSFAATLEPDADRDGFGDETQDRCPGAAGPNDGCVAAPSVPAPAPAPGTAPTPPAAAPAKPRAVVRGLRVRGRTVRYVLPARATVVARVQVRRRGAWRTVRRARVRGAKGTHRVRLPQLVPGRRVVLVARAGGATTRLVAVRPRAR